MRITILVLSLTLTACGVLDSASKNCGGALKQLCYNIVGGRNDSNQDADNEANRRQIDLLTQRLEAEISLRQTQLQAFELQSEATVALIQTQINELQALMAGFASSADIQALQAQIDVSNDTIANLNTTIESLQDQADDALIQLAVLEGYKNIVAIYDPCGPQGGYNEVFLQLSSGQFVASFSENVAGKNTRFTVLTNGNFVTTDGSFCYFTVSGNGTIISNEHN